MYDYRIDDLNIYDISRDSDPKQARLQDSQSFTIEKIVDHINGHTKKKRDLEFKIRWRGFTEAQDLWIPYSELRDSTAIEQYVLRNPELHWIYSKKEIRSFVKDPSYE